MRYNHSLDYAAMAIAYARNGDTQRATKAFARAVTAHDAPDAVRIIEASNGPAHAKLMASKAVAKPVEATKKVVAEFDLGDQADDVLDLEDTAAIEDGDTGAQPLEASDDADEDDIGGDEDDEEGGAEFDADTFDKQFASVLASMEKASKKTKK